MARTATRKNGSHYRATTTATTTATVTTPRKEKRPPVIADDASPLQTPTRQRRSGTDGVDGVYDDIYAVPADDDAANGHGENGLNGLSGADMTPKRKRGRPPKVRPAVSAGDDAVSTPSGKRRRTDAFATPIRRTNGINGAMDTPTRRTLADRSARRKSTRALIDRMVAADEDEDADEDSLGDAILDEDEDEEEEEEEDDDDDDRIEQTDPAENEADDQLNNTAEAQTAADEPAPVVATPRKRGRPPKKNLPVDAQAAADGPQPPKRRPGRPRKNPEAVAREPSPPRELPAHEQYFFQHRAGAATKTSNSTLAALRLLTHDEYFGLVGKAGGADGHGGHGGHDDHDDHERGSRALETLHAQSFAQWAFELAQGFGVCLYGYGAKQRLLHAFAAALYRGLRDHAAHRVVMVDGAAAGGAASVSASAATLRDILLVVAAAAAAPTPTRAPDPSLTPASTPAATSGPPPPPPPPPQNPPRLPQGTAAAERALLGLLDGSATPVVTLVLNGIDAPALRRPAAQATLARLAGHRRIRLLCAADTPNFPMLWDGAARSQLNLVFHDATTFRPLWGATAAAPAHLDPVDQVHALLGRRARRVGGKDGAAFVLRSLPENARALFQLLVGEVLAVVDEGGGGGGGGDGGRRGVGRRRPPGDDEYGDGDDDDDDDDDDADDDDDGYGDGGGGGGGAPEAIGLEYRMLYNKAVEEFICSSEMSFRTLLKEFHDHQMVTSRKDAFGTELLSLPFRRDELEALLEDLAS